MFAKLAMTAIATSVCATAALAGDKVVRMGTEGYYPPFNFFDSAGQIKGFDIDIGNALCERMEVKCEWVTTDWDGIIPALNADKFDTIIASMSITDERSKIVSFTNPYYFNGIRFVAAEGHGLENALPADLKGLVIGTQSATGEVDILEDYFPDSELKLYPKLDDALLDLETGRVDLVLASQFVLGDWLKSDEGGCCEFVGEAFLPDFAKGTGVAVRQDDTDLRDALNAALDAIVEDGTYDKIRGEYFAFDIMTQPKKASEHLSN
ncbi:transporter substrate-binding domain-containing protein [Leisingera sp. ANG-M1]|uniref:transporter substrate-binding domain-containing protein n=1 Tax=Leisingera sp. ANG-M1 TaxID=1577895 RepID=UPI00068B16B0|nr:transporter substrate-binding domain-containing protein [Leisingera sp. ANG-M1]